MSDEKPSEVRAGQRIAKVMSRAGLCSRRDAEVWIAAGRVAVNGNVLDSPAYNVSAADDVRVDGKPLAPVERTRLFLFHKTRGLVTTARDPEGRPTIFEALPPGLPRLVAVGRLDINTEGLILLTNDGGLARVLELPSTGWLRRYRVRAHGTIDQAKLDVLSEGVTVDGVHYAGIEARLDRAQSSNVWLTMGLREGKNREIKKVLDHLGLAVNRLIRVSFGPFELADLAEGEVAEVRTRILRDQLGLKLAAQAGANFDAPIAERALDEPEPDDDKRRAKAQERRERGEARGEIRRPFPADNRDRGAKRRNPPSPSTPARKRKHVSALRAEIAADARGPRKRIERSATQDRKGRPVAVERISPARRAESETTEAPRKRRGPHLRASDAEIAGAGPARERGKHQRGGPEGRARGAGKFLKRRPDEPRRERGPRFDRSGGVGGKTGEGEERRERSFRREQGGSKREERSPSPADGSRRRDFHKADGARGAAGKPGLRGKPRPSPSGRAPRKGPPQGRGPRRPPRKR